ncbi:MAG TPA: ABC transporter permease [Candidatus Sumerlaeota bacterium]|nr:ABC transporter permease [Candidatus Sumerlaeota bacterium]HNM47203.1 ABC transporter permease [Candidatus Sumerlaeota bacterium]
MSDETRKTLRLFFKNHMAVAGLVIVLLLLATALVAQFTIKEDDWRDQQLPVALQPPSAEYILGTDHLGRSVAIRLLYASKTSLMVGVMVVAIGMTMGTVLGLLAGYLGGWYDRIISRVTDVVLAFPFMLLAIAVVATAGPWIMEKLEAMHIPTFSSLPVILALGFASFPAYTRLVRGCVLSIKEEQFVDAARALGSGRWRIMMKHILPNLTGTLMVYGTLRVSTAILAESSLSFLGLGALPPEPTWGNMLSDGREYLLFYPWLPLFPGLAILLTVMGFNFLGDGLRDILDPYHRGD